MTVVMHQPAPAVATIEQPRRRPEFGIGALVFAIMSTIFIASFMCWWSLPFTIVGIVLGITVSFSEQMVGIVLREGGREGGREGEEFNLSVWGSMQVSCGKYSEPRVGLMGVCVC